MKRMKNTREAVLKASRAYYTHRAYYWNLLEERKSSLSKRYEREVDFLEQAFSAHATRPVRQVLDVACGRGQHLLELAKHGYDCTGLDYASENIQMATENAKREGVSAKLLQGDATQLSYENDYDAALAIYVLNLLPDDDEVLKCLDLIYRALRPGGVLVCSVGNPFSICKNWYSLKAISEGLIVIDERARGIRYTAIDRLIDYDPMHGVAWWQETATIEAPNGIHVFRDKERLRLLTYWDIAHYLQEAGFKESTCYPDWTMNPTKKPKAQLLVFVARKD